MTSYMTKTMKKYLDVSEIMHRMESRQKTFSERLDRFGFFHILLIWAFVVTLFGLVYAFLAGKDTFLYSPVTGNSIRSVWDTLYFSFIAATTTGFGDIVPFGLFKIVSIIEVIFGLLLLAFVTSKLVSIKQDAILTEIYEISFNERMTRLRSSLLLFRQNLDRVIGRVEEGRAKKRELQELYMHITLLEDTLSQIEEYFKKSRGRFSKSIDPLNSQLIFNSIDSSFRKLTELLKACEESKLDWKRDVTVTLIRNCLKKYETIWEPLSAKYLTETAGRDAKEQKKTTTEELLKLLDQDPKSGDDTAKKAQ